MPKKDSQISARKEYDSLQVLAKDSMTVIGSVDTEGKFTANAGSKVKVNLGDCNNRYDAEEKLLNMGYGVKRVWKSVNVTLPMGGGQVANAFEEALKA